MLQYIYPFSSLALGSLIFYLFIFLNRIYYLEQFWVHRETEQKARSSHVTPASILGQPPHYQWHRSGTFATTDESTLTHHISQSP